MRCPQRPWTPCVTPAALPEPPTPSGDPATLEWLLADGAGGYACGTAADLPTRRYHGCWIAVPPGQVRRQMILAGVDERFGPGPEAPSLLHAHWGSLPDPSPPRASVAFVHRPFPTWTFRGQDQDGRPFHLERNVLLQRATADRPPLALLRWRNLGDQLLRLHLRPLFGVGDADHLPPADPALDATVHAAGASWGVQARADLPRIWCTLDGVGAAVAEPVWYRGFLYRDDRDRGYDHLGDRWSPLRIELDLPPGQDAVLAVALVAPEPAPAVAWQHAADAACRSHAALEIDPRGRWAELAAGADDFLYAAPVHHPAPGRRRGVLAGFPWFGEWGRDAFVALPGLTLARGDLASCAEVLTGALPFLRRGLLPNIYGADPASSHYGSADAALWWSLAVQRFASAGGDPDLMRERLVPGLAAIAAAYVAGTDLGIRATDAGLLAAGGPELNATWMDARTAAGPVTPRQGFAVELQALWYALLDCLVEHGQQQYAPLRDAAGKAFVQQFWLADGYLADRVHDGVPDRAVRPNMVLAAALPRSPLSRVQRQAVVARAEAVLVTPRGLRTLSPLDPAYRGRYRGGIEARDQAYHQGTVWPWLAGFYVEAALRAATKAQLPKRRQALAAWLDGFLPELDRAGLGHVSEVFDGDLPQAPGGTFAQAWNTGELLRARALVTAKGPL